MSSKRRRRFKDCERKVRHATETDARRAVLRMSRREGHVRPYKCPWCGGWHNGHARTRKNPRGKFKRAIFTALMALWMTPAGAHAADVAFRVLVDGVEISAAQVAVVEIPAHGFPHPPFIYRPGDIVGLGDGLEYRIEIRAASPSPDGPVQQAIYNLQRAVDVGRERDK